MGRGSGGKAVDDIWEKLKQQNGVSSRTYVNAPDLCLHSTAPTPQCITGIAAAARGRCRVRAEMTRHDNTSHTNTNIVHQRQQIQ